MMSSERSTFITQTVAWINQRLAPPGVAITADTPLFAGGLINSIRVLELIAWTERAIGAEIADQRIRMDNFCSVRRIAEVFVAKGGSDAAA
jgi:acyl carrier protein